MNRRSFLRMLSAIPGLGFIANWEEPPRDKFVEAPKQAAALPFNYDGLHDRIVDEMMRDMDKQIISAMIAEIEWREKQKANK